MAEELPEDAPALSVSRKVGVGGAIIGGLMLAVTLLTGSEGDKHHAYLDTTKTPTICYGETQGVTLGQYATQQQCVSMLSADLQARIAKMQKCTHVAVKPEVAAAMIDFAYNAGVGAYCQTPAVLLNEGHTRDACMWLGSHYLTSKGVRLRGLVVRRMHEQALCLKGA